jgi:predicted acylesterase/phospholipase RssA
MNVQVQSRALTAERELPFECVALVLQGGGALGAYQAGVYEALSEAGIHPDRIAGVSIGAINAAIIAGNPPNFRVDRLREFWTHVTADGLWRYLGDANLGLARGDTARNLLSQMSPGFPAIEIEGEHNWDGGLVSNTPLQWVLEGEPRRDTLAFQVRPVERSWRVSAQHARSRNARKGNSLLKPHSRRHGSIQACPENAPRGGGSPRTAAGGVER